MSRTPNNFSHAASPLESIGGDLARALFGDPQAAAEQAKARAEMDARAAQAGRDRAAAGYDNARTTGQTTANGAQASLPEMIGNFLLSQQAPPPPPSVDSAEFADFNTPIPEPEARPDAGSALAALVGAMGQMNGDKIDPTKIMGTVGAFGGGDELARRGLVAQGHSPTADFAITPERADAIATMDDNAKLKQALGVAEINNRDDVPVAQIGADARRYGTDVGAATTRRGQDISASTQRRRQDIKASGAAPGFDVIRRSFPGLAMTSGHRSVEHNREVGGVSNSMHLGNRPGVQAYDTPAIPGVSIEQAAAKIEADNPGIKVVEARDERGRVGPNGKRLGGYHFALANVGGGKPGAAPKRVTPTESDAIEAEMGRQFDGDATALSARADSHHEPRDCGVSAHRQSDRGGGDRPAYGQH